MTILLYDYCDLEERASKHLKAWKVWHLVLFVFAAVFGLMNYVFLQKTMALVEHNCVLFPRSLDFRTVDLTDNPYFNDTNESIDPDNARTPVPSITVPSTSVPSATVPSTTVLSTTVPSATVPSTTNGNDKVKRETSNNETMDEIEGNVTALNGTTDIRNVVNKTHRLAVIPFRILPESSNDCQFAEYMPLLSTVFAAVWITMFTMCAGGGHVRTGLQQPWRLLAPALVFSLLMVALTGHSFVLTNGGLHAFCAEFHNLTNTTTCSAVNQYIELSWNATWGFGGRAASTRAASAGVLASWACATALLLARCLAAPDFNVTRTGVYLKDPQQKLTPYIKKSRPNQRSNPNSPRQRDASLRSEPTITTELVTVEHEQNSAPTSLMVTPLKSTPLRNTENIEMAYAPTELLANSR